MKTVSVVGTRPQFIKAAALLPALRARQQGLAPAGTSETLARARAETLDLQPAGAARRIVEALETAR
jgi:hypothetical protein